ncbi:hypothetical protein AAG570_002847, partial [Ranatra chinensis]
DDIRAITAKRWVPPSIVRRDALSQENRNDIIFRKVRGILNKLTPEKFHKLSDDILKIGLNSTILKGVIFLVFDKALDEPKYSSMYARLCLRLCEEAPNSENDEPCTFRLLLLNSCKVQFESRAHDKANKRKSLGNIKLPLFIFLMFFIYFQFIGELCKLNLISEGILHKCIQRLLEKKTKEKDLNEMGEDLECLCQIMRTCGQILDNEKAQLLMEQYFARMYNLSRNPILPIRIRFMLRDVIELRKERWVPRRATNVEGPLPINQINEDNGPSIQRERLPQQELFSRSLKTRSGFDGVLSGSLTFSQPDKFNLYNSNGFQGFRDRGQSQRQNHHQQQNSPHFYQQNRYNNQHNNNNSNNVSSKFNNKDIPPRFIKRIITGHEQSSANIEEVSLRPPAQSMVFKPPNTKPPSQLFSGNKSSGLLGDAHLTSSSLKSNLPIQTSKEMPILIKQANLDRSKPSKKEKATTKEETMKKIGSISEDVLNGGNISEAVTNFSQLKIPDKLLPECLSLLFSKTFDNADRARENIMAFVAELKKQELIAAAQFSDAFRNLIKTMPDLEANVPNICSYIAEFAANSVTNGLLTIAQIGEVTEDGANFPLLLNTLQELHKVKDKQELSDIFKESKVSLMNSLPEGDRTKERLCEVLEKRGLVFLEPLLVLEAELWAALEREPTAQSLYKCAKESVDPSHHNSPPFVTALLTVCLRYITQESSVGKGVSTAGATEKSLQEKEKALLGKFKSVLQAFLRENINLQVTAVYALQVFCYSLDFPKGMLLRWFVNLYDLEIIEEEAFLKWREDVTDAYPGKGKALFQVGYNYVPL